MTSLSPSVVIEIRAALTAAERANRIRLGAIPRWLSSRPGVREHASGTANPDLTTTAERVRFFPTVISVVGVTGVANSAGSSEYGS